MQPMSTPEIITARFASKIANRGTSATCHEIAAAAHPHPPTPWVSRSIDPKSVRDPKAATL